MSTTAKQIAKFLNVSEAAVSMALNNKPGVSTSTRTKIIQTAKEMGYDFTYVTERNREINETNGSIYFLIYKKNGAIVADTPFFSQVSEGIDLGCKKAHYHLNVFYLYNEESIPEQLKEILRMDCKGMILLGTEMKEIDLLHFKNLSVPIVLLDTYFENAGFDCVLINNIQGAYQAINYLISKCNSQPGYLRSSYIINNFNERADGFYKAVRANGMSISKSVVHSLSPSLEGAYADMLEIINQGNIPEKCYFADNDLIAAGAMKALKEKGYRIPEDVAIIGFDNMPLCNYIEPALSTIHVPKQYMGRVAVERLAYLIETEENSPIKIELSTSLMKRKSV